MFKKKECIAMLLAGGQGSRLYTLTEKTAKPAVPFGGKYRIIDFPMSNCVNSGIDTVGVLTQYQPLVLNEYIGNGEPWDLDRVHGGVMVLPPYQGKGGAAWYKGTANAIFQNIQYIDRYNPDYVLILSGDHIYKMDYAKMLAEHKKNDADCTIAVLPVPIEQASRFGILNTDETNRIIEFEEKPAHPKSNKASMGIYIFNAKAMEEMLNNDFTDFGKEIIPEVIKTRPVAAYLFDSFWEDIGTIKAFYECKLNLASIAPQFNFYNEEMPIYTHRRHLPATKMNFCNISYSLASEGSIITNAYIVNSIVGVRTIIESGASLDGVYCMGASHYETEEERAENARRGIPNIGIGKGTIIRRAIIDQNVRIGDGCRIGIDDIPRPEGDFEMYSIHDGIIVINKNAVIKSGTVI